MAMWLDRFSAHPTPVPSPPREPRTGLVSRPSTQYSRNLRPGLNPRDSTVSLLSNGSTANLPTIGKSSTLRNQLEVAPDVEVSDPLAALEAIVGKALSELKSPSLHEEKEASERPSELIKDIDFGGLSLEEFVNRSAVGQDDRAVSTYVGQSVDEYDEKKTQFQNLHKSHRCAFANIDCDDVLNSVETYLASFQNDLSAVSAEIETLQNRSTTLNDKLENRRKVEKLLGPLVEQITLSPRVVQKISEGPIDEAWIKALDELTNKTKSVEKDQSSSSNSKALEDLKPLLENLSNKAVERIRDHFVAQIKAIRSPTANAQIIQQNQMLKYHTLFAFLTKHQPQLASELMQAYGNTMRWYYSSHFASYESALSKLPLHVTTKQQLLGEDTSKLHATHDPFNLGRRIDILHSRSTAAIPSHLAEASITTSTSSKSGSQQQQQPHYYIETPFHSFTLALVDNASFEYTFLTAFLPRTNPTFQPSLNKIFTNIFTPTFTLAQSLTKRLSTAETQQDALGILLCVRLTQHFAFLLQRRKIPLLEPHVNATAMLLWPRFQSLMDAHTDSLRRLTASLPTRAAAASLSASSLLSAVGGGGSSSSTSASTQSTAPHPITQRFAAFCSAILTLSSETGGDEEPVARSLQRLKAEFEAFLARMSMAFGGGERGKRERERFLRNQYALLVAVTGDAKGRLAEEVRSGWRVGAGLEAEREGVV